MQRGQPATRWAPVPAQLLSWSATWHLTDLHPSLPASGAASNPHDRVDRHWRLGAMVFGAHHYWTRLSATPVSSQSDSGADEGLDGRRRGQAVPAAGRRDRVGDLAGDITFAQDFSGVSGRIISAQASAPERGRDPCPGDRHGRGRGDGHPGPGLYCVSSAGAAAAASRRP